MNEKVYTIKEASQKIYYSERQIRQRCIDGKLKGAYKILEGRKWLIPESALVSINPQQEAPPKVAIEQHSYIETPHKNKMRKLAKALAEGIQLPSTWDKDLWEDIPVEFQAGKYSLSLGAIKIDEAGQIIVKYPNIGLGIAETHLLRALFSHLSTSGLPKFTELMGDNGKLSSLSDKAGQYSQALLMFLKLIAEEVKGYRTKVNFHDELKPGLTKWFITIVWNDAIQKAGGHSWVDDSWYKPHESVTGTNLWQQRCGAYAMGIAKSKRMLKTYENWHKMLRAKYAEHDSAKDIHAKSQELSEIAQNISQLLREFSDIECLPGKCELC